MQTILLIRHARAVDPKSWKGADDLRPLTDGGRRQAQAIAAELGEAKIASIRSSPALRCVQTVEPLAQCAGIELHIDRKLGEGAAITLPGANRSGLHIYCAHGDNIPALLEKLGIECGECGVGSIWMLKRDDAGTIQDVMYVQPV